MLLVGVVAELCVLKRAFTGSLQIVLLRRVNKIETRSCLDVEESIVIDLWNPDDCVR